MTPSKTPEQGLNWLFFDLDDTLWDFAGNSLLSLRSLYSGFTEINSLFTSPAEFIAAYNVHNSSLWRLHHQGKITSGFLRPERWRLTLSAAGADPGHDLCTRLDAAYLSRLCSLPATVEGAHEILHSHSKKYLIGIISNGFTDTQYNKLRVSGLDRFIARMVISDEIGIQKPDSRIFQYAAMATGTKESPIFIGDNVETDILGALGAGWRAIWLNPEAKPFPWNKSELEQRGINPQLLLGSVANLESILPLLESDTIQG